jgi:hypothetical protein
VDLEEENFKLKLEIMTLIMGYENELLKLGREEVSEFSNSCMQRYFNLVKEFKDIKEDGHEC